MMWNTYSRLKKKGRQKKQCPKTVLALAVAYLCRMERAHPVH